MFSFGKYKYIAISGVILLALLAFWARGRSHAKAIRAAQEELARLGEVLKTQEAQLAQTSALLRARNAEIAAASNLCERIEEIKSEKERAKEVIYETSKNDEESAEWTDTELPSTLLDAIRGVLRDTTDPDGD